MSDELNQSTTPKVSGKNQGAADESNDKSETNLKEKNKPRKRQTQKWLGLTETKWRELAAIVMLIPWVWYDLLDSHNFGKLCLLAISLGVAQGVAFSFFKPRWLFITFWLLSLIPVTAAVLMNSRPEPKPHFQMSLKIGDDPASVLVLTNNGFFRPTFVDVLHSTNGLDIFNGLAEECIVIPSQTAESNKVFNFIAENDSSVKVNDLEVVVGFPKDWEIGLDSTKWHKLGGFHLMIPGWSLEVTSLQFWQAESPWPMFPIDTLTFPPITNFSIPKFNNSTNMNGLLYLIVRSTGFESLVAANVNFVRTPSSAFRPFVAPMQETNGIWRPSITLKEFEDFQK